MSKRIRVTISRKDDDALIWVGDRDLLEVGFGGATWLILNERIPGAANRLVSRFIVPTDQVKQVTVTDETIDPS